MSRVNKKFKENVKTEFAEAGYVGRRIGLRIFIICIIITALGVIGGLAIKWFTVGQERKIFKNSITYTETAASFLADRYKEYNDAKTMADKIAIQKYVIMRYPNLDADDIDNMELRSFYLNCLK